MKTLNTFLWIFSFLFSPLFTKGNVYTSCEAMKAEDLRVYSYTCWVFISNWCQDKLQILKSLNETLQFEFFSAYTSQISLFSIPLSSSAVQSLNKYLHFIAMIFVYKVFYRLHLIRNLWSFPLRNDMPQKAFYGPQVFRLIEMRDTW